MPKHIMGKVVSRLKIILCPLRYTTQQCRCCSFTDFTDNPWYYCCKCNTPICEDCYLQHGESPETIICEECIRFIDCPETGYSNVRLIPDDPLETSPDVEFESDGLKIFIDYAGS
jgi:hypothetical protein